MFPKSLWFNKASEYYCVEVWFIASKNLYHDIKRFPNFFNRKLNRNPTKSVNVLKAIRWAVAAWEYDVTPVSIWEGWIKSRLLGPQYIPRLPGYRSTVDEDKDNLNKSLWRWQDDGAQSLERKNPTSSEDGLLVHVKHSHQY